MSKQIAVHAKQNAAPGFTPSRSSLLERRNTLGPHLYIQREATEPEVHPAAPSMVREIVNSPGRPLDAATRSSMEPRFGYDLSRVRVHTDEQAAQSARAVHASAYTAGDHVVFGAGQYSPGTSAGQRTMTHELTHVLQQASGPVPGTPVAEGLSVSHPADPFERAAERVTDGRPPNRAAAELPARRTEAPGITIQRLMTPPKQTTTSPQPSGAPVTAPPGPQPNALSPVPLSPDAWDKIEARIVPELGIDFLQIGRIAAVDVKQQLYDFFAPYDDSIVDANQKFGSYVGVALAGAGNVPQDPGPSSGSSPTYSVTGGLGGAVAQVGQIVVGNILDTGIVGKAKQRASLDVEYLVGDTLTTDSPIYEDFEGSALQEVRAKADVDWQGMQEVFPRELLPQPSPMKYIRYVRREYGVHSKRVTTVLGGLKGKVDVYLAKLKGRLDNLKANAKRQREKAGLIGGAIAGGIIGGAIGLGAGGLAGAAIGLAAGAIGGAFLGGVGSAIFEAAKGEPEQKPRSPEERAADVGKGQSLGKEEAEEEERKEP